MASSKGLELSTSRELKELLSNAATSDALSQDLQQEAKRLSAEQHVTWRQLRPIYNAMRAIRQQEPEAHKALKTCNIVVPKLPEKIRSPELVARLEKLQRAEDDRQYQAMVADITVTERKAEAAKDNSLVTYKDQLGYGVHIIVVMGVFYLMGHMIAASVSSKLSVRAAGGLIGLIVAMFVEAILLIIRTSGHHEKHRKKKSTFLSTKAASALQPKSEDIGISQLQKSKTAKKQE